jgi:hypothetical protein
VFWNYAVSKRRKSPVDVDDLDDQSEVIDAIKDLDTGLATGRQGRSSQYWPKIRERLLKYSSTEDVEEARMEWEDDGLPYKCEGGSCELCDKTPIKYRFPIKNRITGNRLVVGSECIYNYLQIDGYEGPEILRQKLVAQLNFLKKQERGEVEEGAKLESVSGVFLIESKVRRIITSIAGGEPDLDPKEYEESLQEVLHICNHLGVKNATVQASHQALIATHEVVKFLTKLKLPSSGLAAAVSTIMAKRKVEERLGILDKYLGLLNSVAKFGPAKEVISRSWGAVSQKRDSLLGLVVKKCDSGKAQLNSDYRFELEMASPYRQLRGYIEAGIEKQKASFDAQVTTVRKALESDNFVAMIQDGSSALTQALNLEFFPDLNNSDDATQHAAAQVCAFINRVTNGDIRGVTSTIEQLYNLVGDVKDIAGAKVALLRAADDSLVDADVAGSKAVDEFARLISLRDRASLALIEEEVDEVAALVRESSGMRAFERMSQDLEFDVQAAFKLYSSKNDQEKDFCLDLFNRWKEGRIRSLTPTQMSNIRKKMMSGRREVKDSMWGELKSDLMAKFSVVR